MEHVLGPDSYIIRWATLLMMTLTLSITNLFICAIQRPEISEAFIHQLETQLQNIDRFREDYSRQWV